MKTVTNPHTLSELKRQKAFHETMYRQHEEKHQAKQEIKLQKIAQLTKAIKEAEDFNNMEEDAK